MAASTATHGAPAVSKPSTSTTEVEDIDVELTAPIGSLIADLMQARLDKNNAERREKAVKAALAEHLPTFTIGQRLVLRVAGEIRAKVSKRTRTGIDHDLLLSGWPEAFESCKVTTEYDSISS